MSQYCYRKGDTGKLKFFTYYAFVKIKISFSTLPILIFILVLKIYPLNKNKIQFLFLNFKLVLCMKCYQTLSVDNFIKKCL